MWHGELDIIGGRDTTSITSVTTSAADLGSDDQDDDDESPEDGPNLEVENDVTKTNICRILSQGIVFGWTEFNRNKTHSPYIPSVMMDGRKYMFVLYNPVTDTLLTSEGYIHYYPFEDYFGLINLWVILNHRLFFNKQSVDDEAIPSCGFTTAMAEDLNKYQLLMDYKQYIIPETVNKIELQPRISVLSGFKRQRLER